MPEQACQLTQEVRAKLVWILFRERLRLVQPELLYLLTWEAARSSVGGVIPESLKQIPTGLDDGPEIAPIEQILRDHWRRLPGINPQTCELSEREWACWANWFWWHQEFDRVQIARNILAGGSVWAEEGPRCHADVETDASYGAPLAEQEEADSSWLWWTLGALGVGTIGYVWLARKVPKRIGGA